MRKLLIFVYCLLLGNSLFALPPIPPTVINAGSGIAVVTNNINNFTISNTGGGGGGGTTNLPPGQIITNLNVISNLSVSGIISGNGNGITNIQATILPLTTSNNWSGVISWNPVGSTRYFEMVPSALQLVNEGWLFSNQTYRVGLSGSPVVTFTNGILSISGTANGFVSILFTNAPFPAPYFAIYGQINNDNTSGSDALFDVGVAGPTTALANFLSARYKGETQQLMIHYSVGSEHFLSTNIIALTNGNYIALSVQGQWATVYVATNAIVYGPSGQLTTPQFSPVTNVNLEGLFDLRRQSLLTNVFPFVLLQIANGAISMGPVTAGIFGGVGIERPNWIKWDNGEPIVYNGHGYLVATVGGATTNTTSASDHSISATHSAVFDVDLTTYKMIQIGAQFVARNSGILGSSVLGDLFTSCVWDTSSNQWLLLSQTYGDNTNGGTNFLEYSRVYGDPLHGVHVFTNLFQMTMPTAGTPNSNSVWEGDVLKSNSTWYVAYAQNSSTNNTGTQHAALAAGTDLNSLATVFNATSDTGREGQRFARMGGTNYVSSSSTVNCILYDFNGNNKGTIITWGNYFTVIAGAVPSHFAMIPLLDSYGNSSYLLNTFDSQPLGAYWWTHGNSWFFRGTINQNGYEFGVARKWLGF